ncbi:hypothetical protein BWZ20_12910 [Winogradskyella sp. J14-2]|uniref:hypothetical protein n=1 Tax=Winogradskyella sp. J14-2 TaxID=1936080 RepID=UPI000972A242|nr:hypothetical protein [Winogradskyella sp. J14-2]APY09147.1 hypothetical protein BWZ20_12910 [Winogradskyella sp. J14-2]
MNIKFIKFSLVAFLLILQFNCDELTSKSNNQDQNKESCEAELQEIEGHLDTPFSFNERIPPMFEFCKDSAAITSKNKYNTITGIAHFSVPIPKGSNLNFIKKDVDTLKYVCNGHGKIVYGENDLILEHKTVANLPRKEGQDIYVSVNFKNFKENGCDNIDILQEKKKKSKVEGEPFRSMHKREQ